MNSDINLIKRETEASQRRIRLLRTVALVFAGFVILTSIILFILNSGNSLDSVKREQNVSLTNLSFLSEKGGKLALLTDRLRNIEKIISTRKNYIKSVTTIIDGLPSDSNASSIALDKDGLSLTVSSNSLVSINNFLNSLIKNSEKHHLIKDLTIESLTVASSGIRYSLSIKAKFL